MRSKLKYVAQGLRTVHHGGLLHLLFSICPPLSHSLLRAWLGSEAVILSLGHQVNHDLILGIHLGDVVLQGLDRPGEVQCGHRMSGLRRQSVGLLKFVASKKLNGKPTSAVCY